MVLKKEFWGPTLSTGIMKYFNDILQVRITFRNNNIRRTIICMNTCVYIYVYTCYRANTYYFMSIIDVSKQYHLPKLRFFQPQFIQPLVFLELLQGLADHTYPANKLYGVAVGLFCLMCFRMYLENHYFYGTFRLGAQVIIYSIDFFLLFILFAYFLFVCFKLRRVKKAS